MASALVVVATGAQETEPNGTPGTATVLLAGSELTAAIDPVGDVDLFSIDGVNETWGFVALLDTSASSSSQTATLSALRNDGVDPASARAARVQVGAQAAFFARGVRRTRQRVGILVYISLLERSAEVLADDGVIAEVPAEPWAEAVAAIVRQVGAGADGAAVAKAIEGLAPVLEGCLPRAEDDVNELPDEVDA